MAMPPVTAFSAPNQAQIGGGTRVKEERADEAEIQAIANKIIEQNRVNEAANKAKQAAQAANMARLVQSGLPASSIQNYLIRTPAASAAEKSDLEVINDLANIAEPKNTEPTIDDETLKGHFGWETILKTHFPYVLRRGEKYSSVRIIDSKVLYHYLSVLRPEIYSCTSIKSVYMTEAEARMFNEINTKHCDCTYGNALFTNHDLLVKVSDVCEFYKFLDMCVNKLCNDRSQPGDRCGFVRINGESVVPYTISGTNQFVPLFYFEGETDTLKLKAEKLGGWDLSYLKFCCKVQGIRNELFASDLCSVISLDDIKSYFPPGTLFEDYWPTKGVDKTSLIDPTKSQLKGGIRSGAWTIQPKEPPPPMPKIVPKVPVIAAPTVSHVANGWNGLIGGQQQQQPQQQQQFQTANVMPQQQQQQFTRIGQTSMVPNNLYSIGGLIYNNTQSSQNGQTANYYNQAHSLPTGVTPQPPPLVRTTSSSNMNLTANLRPSPAYPGTGTRQAVTASLVTPTSRSTPNSLLLNQASTSSTAALIAAQMLGQQQQLTRQQTTQQQQQQQLLQQQQQHQRLRMQQQYQYQQVQQQRAQVAQPTVQRTNNMAQLTQRLLQQNNSSQLQIQLQQQQQQAALRQQQQVAASKQHTSPPPLVPTNGISRSGVDVGSSQKLTPLPEVSLSAGNTHAPYKVQKALVNKVLTPCINAKPYHNSELLMTMSDLVTIFFPNTQLHNCRKVLQEVLNIELFKGNSLQMRTLMEAGKCSSINETLPLIQVQDVMKYYPQLSYILKMKNTEFGNASKRQRVS